MNPQLHDKKVAVIGLGISNISVIRYLIKHDLKKLVAYDTRENPPHVQELPVGIDLHLGPLDANELKAFDLIVISPGISIYNEELQAAIKAGVEVVGDVELFARVAKAPVVGITGSNGKSTVTALLGYMANTAKLNVAVGANFGVPVFDILKDEVELYVLELSSFELETTKSLELQGAVILNVSEDHLDRYHGSIEEYAEAKKRIFMHAKNVVVNRDDKRTYPDNLDSYNISSFGLDASDYGLIKDGDDTFLGFKGEKLLNVNKLHIFGVHNWLNALACMALASSCGISREAQIKALVSFTGLQHRCQLVKNINDICYYNDSKATNVASAIAAIDGLKDIHKNGIILLAGGLGKGQDFSPFIPYLGREIKKVFCFGKDKDKLLALSKDYCVEAVDMYKALELANCEAKAGQAILLSPACASFDQFKGFEDRGACFVNAVLKLDN